MGKHGTAAVRARERYEQGHRPIEIAWQVAVGEVFPNAPESRRKGCPRNAFLGLCAAGMVDGVAPAPPADIRESVNAKYAVTAVHLLENDPRLAEAGASTLWRRVMEELGLEPTKRPNGQMDVVISLWKAGLLSADNAA